MSFLAWAFGLGVLAIGFPFVFHLIRRTPRGRQDFSSLMFLKPSPPRLTRRSRLDNLFLLLLRALAIILLAVAFMRPFLRENVSISSAEIPGRRVAILVDTSASMRSGKCWENAKKEVAKVVRRLESSDDMALFTFDRNVKTVIDFESDQSAVPTGKRSLIKAELDKIAPGWQATDLANALITVADSMDIKNEINQNKSALQIVVVSDFQNGAQIDSLQSYQWPKSVRVEINSVKSGQPSNANVRILKNADELVDLDTTRIRVANAADSKKDQFVVHWTAADGSSDPLKSIPFYVPAGTSRVLQIERDPTQFSADRLSLNGDDVNFDNQYFTIPTERRSVQVVYLGDEKDDDANQLLYFLKSAFGDDDRRTVDVVQVRAADALDSAKLDALEADLVFVSREIDSATQNWLSRHLKNRGSVLAVLQNKSQLPSLEPIIGKLEARSTPRSDSPPKVDEYVLLADIRFAHPLFVPFANPRYNDFTKIHFWQHLQLDITSPALTGDQVQVIARFDDDAPALIQKTVDGGQIYLLTAGWSPDQSELALSTKFVPLMNILLGLAGRQPKIEASCHVGQPFVLPRLDNNLPKTLLRPDGRRDSMAADQTVYKKTDTPGIYTIQSGDQSYRFAVNLQASESDTSPMPIEKLQMHNVLIGQQTSQSTRLHQMQLLKDKELENRQKIWKWLIVAALGFLLFETLFAGIAARRSSPIAFTPGQPNVGQSAQGATVS